MAGDLRPRHLHEIARTIDLEELSAVLGRFIAGGVRGRIVVRIASGPPAS